MSREPRAQRTRPARLRTRALLAAVLLLAGAPFTWPAELGAQQPTTLRARIILQNGAPARGVHVVATRTDGEAFTERAIASEAGQIQLSVPTTGIRLTARRIGHAPIVLAELDLVASAERDFRFVLEDAPVSLATVVTRARNACAALGRAAPELVSLVDDVRLALSSVRFVPPGHAITSRVLLTDKRTTAGGVEVSLPVERVQQGVSLRPFQAVSASTIERVGYVSEEPDGTVYRAPDSEILTSSHFLSSHCFAARPPEQGRPDRLGIAFEPVNRPRDVVDIRGTFWLDRETRELRELEFTWVGLPAALSKETVGGSVEFLNLADGVFFERRWELRMPRSLLRRRVEGVPPYQRVIDQVAFDGLQVRGGEVLEMRRSGAVLYAGPRSDIVPGNAGVGDDAAVIAGVCGSEMAGDAAVGLVIGVVRGVGSPSAVGATVVAEWKQDFRVAGPDDFRWTIETRAVEADPGGAFVLCGVPRNRPITLVADAGTTQSGSLIVRIPDGDGRARVVRVELVLRPDAISAAEVEAAASGGWSR